MIRELFCFERRYSLKFRIHIWVFDFFQKFSPSFIQQFKIIFNKIPMLMYWMKQITLKKNFKWKIFCEKVYFQRWVTSLYWLHSLMYGFKIQVKYTHPLEVHNFLFSILNLRIWLLNLSLSLLHKFILLYYMPSNY